MSTWEKETCPNCKAVNWVYLGNLDDVTAPDIDGWKCHKCEKIHIFLEIEDFLNIHGAEVSVDLTEEEMINRTIETRQVFIEDGLEKPK